MASPDRSQPPPPRGVCARCLTVLPPDVAVLNWLWGKRCQMCRARFCRACVNREVRQERHTLTRRRTQSHESAHTMLANVELENPKATATLGRWDPRATYGPLSTRPGAFIVGERSYANATEAAAETFAAYVIEPGSLGQSASRWLEAKLVQSGPDYWRESIGVLRTDSGSGTNGADYRCPYCGHLWHELGGFGGAEGG